MELCLSSRVWTWTLSKLLVTEETPKQSQICRGQHPIMPSRWGALSLLQNCQMVSLRTPSKIHSILLPLRVIKIKMPWLLALSWTATPLGRINSTIPCRAPRAKTSMWTRSGLSFWSRLPDLRSSMMALTFKGLSLMTSGTRSRPWRKPLSLESILTELFLINLLLWRIIMNYR